MALANTPVPPLFQGLNIKNTIYFVENELSGTPPTTTAHLKRPRLIIGGKYDGGPTTYYRVRLLRAGRRVGRTHFTSDILRNHLYRFTINSVSGPGQDKTANEADATIPEKLRFHNGHRAVGNRRRGHPEPADRILYAIHEGLNGDITYTKQTGRIPVKTRTWKGRQPSNIFDYNTFYGEADNFWAHLSSADPGNWNGDLDAMANREANPSQYNFAALKTEGSIPDAA